MKLKTEIAKVRERGRQRGRERHRERGRQRERQTLVSHTLQAQLSSLPPLVVPKRLVHKEWRTEEREEEERVREGEGVEVNQTDQEKSVVKETANLLEVRLPLQQ